MMILPFVSVVREKVNYLQEMFQDAGIVVGGYMGAHRPAGGFKATDISICTIEKANNLFNRLMEENRLDELGILVVDELHMLGDSSRGYLLELLLTKLLYNKERSKIDIQIIGMSATLPNLNVLASWLKAELYYTDFRPVPLLESYKIGSTIYNSKTSRVMRNLQNVEVSFPNDSDHTIYLTIETIAAGHGVLIFCPSKNWCEKLAINIAREIYNTGRPNNQADGNKALSCFGEKLREHIDGIPLNGILQQLKDSPAGLDSVLSLTVPFGVAFHHAGLTFDERDIVEGAFKQGILKVLVATTTLSSGVNLPAKRVIIRSPLFCGAVIDVLSYKQMVGRAGRKGIDSSGESILICKDSERSAALSLVKSELPPVKSCLMRAGSNSLHSSLKRALIEVIASGVVSSHEQVIQYASCTLLFASLISENDSKNVSNDDVEISINKCLTYLLDNEFIFKQEKNENEFLQISYKPSQLGLAILASGFSPDDALRVLKELQLARRCFVLENDLHILYEVTPPYLTDQMGSLNWMQFLSIWEQLSEEYKRVAELVGVQESFIGLGVQGKINKNSFKTAQKLAVHQRFFATLALNELIQEVPLSVVSEKYNCTKGILQSLQQTTSSFAGMLTIFCNRLGWHNLELLFSQFQKRVHFGVQQELCELVQLSTLNAQRARFLYNAGFETIVSLANAEPAELALLLCNAGSFISAKQLEGDMAEEAVRRCELKRIRITGKVGVDEKEAAILIIKEAQQFIKQELGVKTISWQLHNTMKLSNESIQEKIGSKLMKGGNEENNMSFVTKNESSDELHRHKLDINNPEGFHDFKNEKCTSKKSKVIFGKSKLNSEPKVVEENEKDLLCNENKPTPSLNEFSQSSISNELKSNDLNLASYKSCDVKGIDKNTETKDSVVNNCSQSPNLCANNSDHGSEFRVVTNVRNANESYSDSKLLNTVTKDASNFCIPPFTFESSLNSPQNSSDLEDDASFSEIFLSQTAETGNIYLSESFSECIIKEPANTSLIKSEYILPSATKIKSNFICNSIPYSKIDRPLTCVANEVSKNSLLSESQIAFMCEKSFFNSQENTYAKNDITSLMGKVNAQSTPRVSFNGQNFLNKNTSNKVCSPINNFINECKIAALDLKYSCNTVLSCAPDQGNILDSENDSEASGDLFEYTEKLEHDEKSKNIDKNITITCKREIESLGKVSEDFKSNNAIESTGITNNLHITPVTVQNCISSVDNKILSSNKLKPKNKCFTSAVSKRNKKHSKSVTFLADSDSKENFPPEKKDEKLPADGDILMTKSINDFEKEKVDLSEKDCFSEDPSKNVCFQRESNSKLLELWEDSQSNAFENFEEICTSETELLCKNVKTIQKGEPFQVLESWGECKKDAATLTAGKNTNFSKSSRRKIEGINLIQYKSSLNFFEIEEEFKNVFQPYVIGNSIELSKTNKVNLSKKIDFPKEDLGKKQCDSNAQFFESCKESQRIVPPSTANSLTKVNKLSKEEEHINCQNKNLSLIHTEYNSQFFKSWEESQIVQVEESESGKEIKVSEESNLAKMYSYQKQRLMQKQPEICSKIFESWEESESNVDKQDAELLKETSIVFSFKEEICNKKDTFKKIEDEVHSKNFEPQEEFCHGILSNAVQNLNLENSPEKNYAQCKKNESRKFLCDNPYISPSNDFCASFSSDCLSPTPPKSITLISEGKKSPQSQATKNAEKSEELENLLYDTPKSTNTFSFRRKLVSPEKNTYFQSTIVKDVTSFANPETLEISGAEMRNFFKKLEKISRFSLAVACEKAFCEILSSIGPPKAKDLKAEPELSICTIDPGIRLIGLAIYWNQNSFFIRFADGIQSQKSELDISVTEKIQLFQEFLQKKSGHTAISIFDLKTQYKMLWQGCKVYFPLNSKIAYLDPSIASWMLDSDKGQESLQSLVGNYMPDLSYLIEGFDKRSGSIGCHYWSSINGVLRASREAYISFHLMESLMKKLRSQKLYSTFRDVEMPALLAVSKMEQNGLGFNLKLAMSYRRDLQTKQSELLRRTQQLAGRSFNIKSSHEISRILFKELKLSSSQLIGSPLANKHLSVGPVTRSGSRRLPPELKTNKECLEKVMHLHPLPKAILDWRRISFAITKVLMPFLKENKFDHSLQMNRLYSTCYVYTVTGRINMHTPNLQFVPRDFNVDAQSSNLESDKNENAEDISCTDEDISQYGISLRKMFIPSVGSILLSADYSQLELRILAHLSGDAKLIKSLNSGDDIFVQIASSWKKIAATSVSDVIRQQAKKICYGIIYGMSAKTLSHQLNTTEAEAATFMQSFKASYPGLSNYLKSIVEKCRLNGRVYTINKRYRLLPEICSEFPGERAHAERQAVNTTIQGSASDLIKTVMVRIEKELNSSFPENISPFSSVLKYGTKHKSPSQKPFRGGFLVLHLHDELIFEVNKSDLEQVMEIVKRTMETTVLLSVKLPVKIKVGLSWGSLEEVA